MSQTLEHIVGNDLELRMVCVRCVMKVSNAQANMTPSWHCRASDNINAQKTANRQML